MLGLYFSSIFYAVALNFICVWQADMFYISSLIVGVRDSSVNPTRLEWIEAYSPTPKQKN
jgi:hypothetical protein